MYRKPWAVLCSMFITIQLGTSYSFHHDITNVLISFLDIVIGRSLTDNEIQPSIKQPGKEIFFSKLVNKFLSFAEGMYIYIDI